MFCFLLLIIFMLHGMTAHAEDYVADDKIPDEVKPFIEEGMRLLTNESADLNGDGRSDYILVFETETEEKNDLEREVRNRSLFILVREPNGNLQVAKRNDKIVFCSTCGGMMRDPFQGISVGPKTFTVHHYGGSGWRWSIAYTFRYSRLDRTWQLVEAEESDFHAGDPEESLRTKIYSPPNDYGKIDIADFDTESYRAQDTCPGVIVQGEENEVSLATVKGGPRTYFISQSTETLSDCPSDSPACRLKAYLVPGDVVLARSSVGKFRCVTFRSVEGTETNGFLPKDALIDEPLTSPTPNDWAGKWVRDEEASITITVKGDALAVKGDATFGGGDPERIERGAVNIGEIEEMATPRGNLIAIGSDYDGMTKPTMLEANDCRVRLRLFGRYLAVDDNGGCGGLNVSFTGVYSRRS